MEKLESGSEKSKMEMLADKLFELQSKENDGRGITCVRTIVDVLRRGDIEGAKTVYLNDGDKVRAFPHIREILDNELVNRGDFD